MPEKIIIQDKATLEGEKELKDCSPSSEAAPVSLVVPAEEVRKLGCRILARYQAAFETLRNI